jgi:small subunit ribosomal protein S3
MGQKVNPIGLRVGINRTWDSRWFDDRNYAEKLVQDLELRKYVTERLKLPAFPRWWLNAPRKTPA